MDLTESIIPKSDQLNADDLIAGPQTFTVREVKKGAAEQPVDIMLAETDRAYRPSKSMRRVLVSAWGREGTEYAGHKLTLYRDPEVTFGRDKVGGIKISHLSHIDGPLSIMLTATRGSRKPHNVAVLVDLVATCTDTDTLRAMYRRATTDDERSRITARVAEIGAVPA
jgi:hypothetical protein